MRAEKCASVTTTGKITAKKAKDRDYASFEVLSFGHDEDSLPVAERSHAYCDYFEIYSSPKAKKFDYTDYNSKANPLKVKNTKRTVKANKVSKKAVVTVKVK